jgi:DTW domain-containing protein YfiP
MARNHSPGRCPKCQIFQPLCICALAPRLALSTRVVIFMHFRELPLTTNTARLATAALVNSEIRVRGRREQPVDARDLAADSALAPYVLYPSEDSEELSEKHVEEARTAGKALTLIVPDGNWRQGAKAVRRTPGLEKIPCLRIPSGAPSEYVLRTAPRADFVSTYEAIARALRVTESSEVHDRLMEYFRIKIDRTLWARGLLATEKVRGGVPPEAIESFFIAGSRGSVPRDERSDE